MEVKFIFRSIMTVSASFIPFQRRQASSLVRSFIRSCIISVESVNKHFPEMSSKKKNNVVECPKCICCVLWKDLELHQEECSGKNWTSPEDLFTSKTNIIIPHVGMIGNNQNVTNTVGFLPPDLIGWEKWNTVLMHPETMYMLRISARQPCWLTNIDSDSDADTVATIWPCDQVKEMQICVLGIRIGAKICVNIWNKILKVSVVKLRPSVTAEGLCDENLSIYSTRHFRDYVKTYLSNGYLGIGMPVRIHYYGREHNFDVILSDEEKFRILDISSECSVPLILKPEPNCIFQISVNSETSSKTKPLTFADFGGAQNVKMEIMEELIDPLKNAKEEACSVILSGDTGCGKSLFLRIIQQYLQEKAMLLSRKEFIGFLEDGISKDCGKMAILVDDFDKLTEYSGELCELMEAKPNLVFVLAVRNIEAIEMPLRRRFPCELQLPVPSLPERMEILRILFMSPRMDLALAEELAEFIAQKSHGYTGSDLKAVCHKAFNLIDSKTCNSIPGTSALFECFNVALKRIRPTGIRQFVLEIPDVNWDDIGGNRKLKLKIERAISWPYKHQDLFKSFGKKPPSGILLYGPPGCSKTLIARAIASQSRMNFLAVKGPELFNKWVGESERAVRELFRRARQVAPAIIFFDEIDAIGATRGSGNESHVGERVLQQLLTELDGLEKKGDVLVLAATNRPDRLDSALLRPGRLDLKIHVPLPDEETRREILSLRLSRMTVCVDVDVEDIARRTNGFSGAEVVQLCEEAADVAMLESKEADRLESRHFLEALNSSVPRTDPNLLVVYEKFEKGFMQ